MSNQPHCLADGRAFQRYLDAVTSLNDAAILADHRSDVQQFNRSVASLLRRDRLAWLRAHGWVAIA